MSTWDHELINKLYLKHNSKDRKKTWNLITKEYSQIKQELIIPGRLEQVWQINHVSNSGQSNGTRYNYRLINQLIDSYGFNWKLIGHHYCALTNENVTHKQIRHAYGSRVHNQKKRCKKYNENISSGHFAEVEKPCNKSNDVTEEFVIEIEDSQSITEDESQNLILDLTQNIDNFIEEVNKSNKIVDLDNMSIMYDRIIKLQVLYNELCAANF